MFEALLIAVTYFITQKMKHKLYKEKHKTQKSD